MILHVAEVLIPVISPIQRNAGVLVDADGLIHEIGAPSILRTKAERTVHHQVLMPGVINAHTHLVDSDIEEPIAGGDGLPAWVRRLMEKRLSLKDGDGDEERIPMGPMQSVSPAAVDRVLSRMRECGAVAIGEVCNGVATLEIIRRAGMRCRFIQEVLAFPRERAEHAMGIARDIEEGQEWSAQIRPSIGAHAPYSVSPELMSMICAHNRSRGRFAYQHLAEDPAERELYVDGRGAWRDFLEMVGAWDPALQAPGIPPIELYDRLGILTSDLVAVHLADATPEEIALLAARGVRAILSPTSNRVIGNRLPDFSALARSGMTLALGTDGCGSNPSVDVFDEARLLAEEFPEIDPAILVRALTAGGANVLGFEELGGIAVGMSPGFVSVELSKIPEGDELFRAVLVDFVSRKGFPPAG